LKPYTALNLQNNTITVISIHHRADEGAWRGAVRLATSGKVDQIWVTKQEYEEKGHILCRQKLKEVEDVLWQKGKKSSSSAAGAGGTSIKK
jgi:hypothetical protein